MYIIISDKQFKVHTNFKFIIGIIIRKKLIIKLPNLQ